MKRTIGSLITVALALTVSLAAGTAPANAGSYSRTVTWAGNGVSYDDGFALNTEICGTENGAPVDGPYLYWVLTASKASLADISIDGSAATAMEKKGKGAFHYLQTFVDDLFVSPISAESTHNGPIDKKANLVLSHGCDGEPDIDCSIVEAQTFSLVYFESSDVTEFSAGKWYITPSFDVQDIEGTPVAVNEFDNYMFGLFEGDFGALESWGMACLDPERGEAGALEWEWLYDSDGDGPLEYAPHAIGGFVAEVNNEIPFFGDLPFLRFDDIAGGSTISEEDIVLDFYPRSKGVLTMYFADGTSIEFTYLPTSLD